MSRLPWIVGVTSTPLPSTPGSWKTVECTVSPADLSSSRYSPRRGVMWILSLLTILCSTPEYTPAALTTARVTRVCLSVITNQVPFSPGRTWETLVPRRNSTPFWMAFSPRATVIPKGQTMPPVGAQRAATADRLTLGSMSRRCRASMIFRPSTPFWRPFS